MPFDKLNIKAVGFTGLPSSLWAKKGKDIIFHGVWRYNHCLLSVSQGDLQRVVATRVTGSVFAGAPSAQVGPFSCATSDQSMYVNEAV